MTSEHVSRLLEAYSLISPLLFPVIRRRTAEFCQPMDYTEWAEGWYRFPNSVPKKPHRLKLTRKIAKTINDPRKNVEQRMAKYKRTHSGSPTADNWGRYREVNIEALSKHGTIEFRSMGAIYNYEYLTRWAWMCRELTNYAQSTKPIKPFYTMKTLEEVLNFLELHAVEKLSPRKAVK